VIPNDTTAAGDVGTRMVPRGRVVVVGSANEDIMITAARLPRPGETVVGRSLILLPGGKSANQAVAAARAGAATWFVGAVGADDAGARALASLRAEGVDVGEVVTVDDVPTGTAAIVVDDSGENQITIVAGANGVLDGDHVTKALRRLALRTGDVVLVGFEVGDDAVAAAARCTREAGSLLVVNPAPARALCDDVIAAHPILIPNTSEAVAISRLDDEEHSIRRLAAITGAPVVITLGARGALVFEEGRSEIVPSLQLDALDTTGAGDTLAGVLAAGLADGLQLTAAVARAVIAAALSVTVRGARPGSPTRATIDAALTEHR
jgi:ribokinase